MERSSNKHTRSASLLDLVLGSVREELCLHDHRLLGENALAQHFVVAGANDVDNGRLLGHLLVLLSRLLSHQRPQPANNANRA